MDHPNPIHSILCSFARWIARSPWTGSHQTVVSTGAKHHGACGETQKKPMCSTEIWCFFVEFLLNRGMVGEHNLRFLFLLQGAFFFLPQITPKKNPKNVKKVEENFTSAALVDPCKSRIPMDAFFLGDKKSGCDKIRWTGGPYFSCFQGKGVQEWPWNALRLEIYWSLLRLNHPRCKLFTVCRMLYRCGFS